MFHSWLYALGTSALLFIFLIALSAASSSLRKTLFWGLAFSPVFLATAWSRISGSLSFDFLPAFFLCSLGLALLQLPFASLWIEKSLSSLNDELLDYARSAGLREKQIFWGIKVPFLTPVFSKVLTYSFCIALGEIALASIWLRDWPLLSLISKRLAQSYDFQAAAWTFLMIVVSAIAARLFFSHILRRIFR